MSSDLLVAHTCNACDPCKQVKRLGWRGLWMTKNIEGTVDDDIAAKLAIGEGRQVCRVPRQIRLGPMFVGSSDPNQDVEPPMALMDRGQHTGPSMALGGS